MSTRSRQIRAQRRAKEARRWPETKKPAGSGVHGGLAKDSEIGVSLKPSRAPWQATRAKNDWE